MNIFTIFSRSQRTVLTARMLVVFLIAFASAMSVFAQATLQITEMLKKHNLAAKQAFTPPQQLMFIENKGQWQGNDALGTPRFLARTRGANVWVMDDGFVYDFAKHKDSAHHEGHVVKMRFADITNNNTENSKEPRRRAASSPSGGLTQDGSVKGVQKLPGYYNYFLGSDSTKWAANVPLYAEVRMNALAEGISARTYFDEGSVRYDLIVAPGADPSRIALQFDGIDAEKIHIGKNGDLVLQTSIGEVMQGKLFAYQIVNGKKVQVACAFQMLSSGVLASSRPTAPKPPDGANDALPPSDRLPSSARSHGLTKDANPRISFALGAYNPALPLIIDPLVWSTFLGGTGEDDLYHAVSFDASNNVYTAGRTQSTNFPTTGGAYQTTYPGGLYAGVVTKLNPTGTGLIFSTFLGGGALALNAMSLDASNNIYIAGNTGPGYPTTLGTYAGGTVDWFITKLNASGNALLYSRYFGGGTDDAAYDISVDASGNAYVSGHTYSNDFSISGGCYQNVRNGLSDGAVCKLDGSGNMIYSTYIGGSNDDFPIFNEIDASGNVYLMGYSKGSYPTTGGVIQPTFGGGNLDIVVTKMNSTGTGLIYSTYLGGTGDEIARGIILDASNNVYVSGQSTGVTPITLGPAYSGGTSDGILFSLNAAGSALNFSRYIGGSGADDLLYLTRDGGTGDIYAVGYTTSTNYPTSLGAYQTALAGGYDIVLTKLNSAASTILYSTYIGGANDDLGKYIAFSATNTVLLSGTASTGFPTTAGAQQTTYGGGTADGFVTKFSTVPEPPTVTGFTATTGYPGLGIVINGTNFIGVTQVQFGGVNSPSFTVISPTQLVAAVPAGGASGSVSVTNPSGTGSLAGFTFTATVPQVSTFAGNGAGAGFANGQKGAARFNGPYGVCSDAVGNIYVADAVNARIRKIDGSGNVTTYAGTGVVGFNNGLAAGAQFNAPYGVCSDAAGNIYVADGGNHRIRKIDGSGNVTTYAGTGVAGSANGAAASAQFNGPNAVCSDATGNIYVADSYNHLIRKIDGSGNVSTYAGTGVAGFANGAAASAQFNVPSGVCSDAAGNIYVADYFNHLIRKIDGSGNVSTYAGTGVAGFNDGAAASAQFNGPYGVCSDAAGNIYVPDGGNKRIRKIDGSGNVSTFAGTGVLGFNDGVAASAQFNDPTGVCSDAAGNIYVADYGNNRIRKFTPAPPTVTSFTATTGYPGLGIVINGTNFVGVTQVQFGGVVSPSFTVISPTQLVAAVPAGGASGNVSVINAGGTGSLAGFTFTGTVPQVSTFAGNNTISGFANAQQGAASFVEPMSVAFDGSGNLYVADQGNHAIRKITSAGVVTTLAGSGVAGFADGTGVAAQFSYPNGIAMDAAGNIYVADGGNHRIRRVTPAGVVTTLAGSGTAAFADGTGTAAQFNLPVGIAFDGAGTFLSATKIITVFAGLLLLPVR